MDFRQNIAQLEEFIGVLFIIFSGFVVTALYKMVNYVTFPNLDELLWYGRSRIFWDKMLSFDFSGLIQSAQPGITVYWFTGFVMKFIDFDFTYVGYLIREKELAGGDYNDVVNANDQVVYALFEKVSFLFNFPLFILTVIFFIAFYYLIKRIGFNRVISSFALFFLVSNIFFIYWTTPSDKMLDIFMTLSFLTFLIYLKERSAGKYLIYSAIFGSWAVLSKISALFIIPFFLFAYLYCSWPIDRKKIFVIARDMTIWTAVFSMISLIFLPTIVARPAEVYNLIFTNSGNIYETRYAVDAYISRLLEYSSPMLIVFGSSMSAGIIIYLAAFACLAFRKKFRMSLDLSPRREVYLISVYVILFMVEVTVLSKNHDVRFMSPVLVMMNVLVGVAFFNVIEVLRKKLNLGTLYYYHTAMAVLILSQIIAIVSTGIMMQDLIRFYNS